MRAAFFAVILPVAPLRGAIADVDWRGHAIASSGDTRVLHGRASFYGNRFIGRETASGERYDADAMTAAHKTLPIGTKVRVTAPSTWRTVVVRINDRGPYLRGRSIDLSRSAARALGITGGGVADVTIEVVSLLAVE